MRGVYGANFYWYIEILGGNDILKLRKVHRDLGVGNGTLTFGGWEWYIEIWVVGNGTFRFGGWEWYIEIWVVGNGILRFGGLEWCIEI